MSVLRMTPTPLLTLAGFRESRVTTTTGTGSVRLAFSINLSTGRSLTSRSRRVQGGKVGFAASAFRVVSRVKKGACSKISVTT